MKSFEALRLKLESLPAPDVSHIEACEARENKLTKPLGALGRLEELSAWMSAWRGHPPAIGSINVIVFAGTHGVTAQGVSAYPSEVTRQMVANFDAGGAAINQLARLLDAKLDVIPLSLERPTADLSVAPAMTEQECMEALTIGYYKALSSQGDLHILGEMGIGNTTSASAIGAALFSEPGVGWAGPGTGLNVAGVRHKAEVVDRALALHGSLLSDPFEILRCLGGREIAALAGAILGSRAARVPVILDGFVVTMAAAALNAINPDVLAHCIAGHVSAEPAHRRLLDKLNLQPLLDLDMRLGEGSGAAVAALLIKAALACHNGMATFGEAGVSAAGRNEGKLELSLKSLVAHLQDRQIKVQSVSIGLHQEIHEGCVDFLCHLVGCGELF